MEKHKVEFPLLPVECGRVQLNDGSHWGGIRHAFDSALPITLQQAWLEAPAPEFRSASVRIGWNQEALLIYARLHDADIFNPVTTFNAPAYQHGDAFEIFLRPARQDAYYEFHVSPLNQKFQLRIPSEADFKAPRPDPGIPPAWMIDDRKIGSRVESDAARECWEVLAMVPLAMVAEAGPVQAGDEWLFSFSRYDYTRGNREPVLSSSSPHQVLSFHRQEEWGRFRFV